MKKKQKLKPLMIMSDRSKYLNPFQTGAGVCTMLSITVFESFWWFRSNFKSSESKGQYFLFHTWF